MKAKAVFITSDSDGQCVHIWDAEIGIVKEEDCVRYYAGDWCRDEIVSVGCLEWLSHRACKEKYGFFPAPAEAWLVRIGHKWIHWTHVSPDMALLDHDGKKLTAGVKVMKI